MLFDHQVLAFTGLAFLLTISPGPDTMLVVRNTLARGKWAGVATCLGSGSGLFVHAAVSGLGLSVILVRSAALFHAVKLLGAAYLAWLGFKSLAGLLARRKSRTDEAAGRPKPARPKAGRSRSYTEGLLNNLLNPKVAVFYLAFLPQFIQPGDPVLLKSILLAAIHNVMGVAWLSMVAFFLGYARAWFARPAVTRKLEALTGAILVGFAVRLALEES